MKSVADPLTVECSACKQPAWERCVRVDYNRPPRLRDKGPHYERRRDADALHAMKAALL